jgi:hypothetical protein
MKISKACSPRSYSKVYKFKDNKAGDTFFSRGMVICVWNLQGENEKESDQLKKHGVDGRIIIKFIFKK